MARKKRLITNGYVVVCNETDLSKAEIQDYKYEHIVVAEKMLGRPLNDDEDVHHLDKNRTNNSPENLLVINSGMHCKLHAWMNKNIIIPTPEYQERIDKGCVRCKNCEKPINDGEVYCSILCYNISARTVERPNKETLEKLIQEKPMTKIGEDYGVSDNAVRKWCKSLDINLPNRRGYWTNLKGIDIDVYELEVDDDTIKLTI